MREPDNSWERIVDVKSLYIIQNFFKSIFRLSNLQIKSHCLGKLTHFGEIQLSLFSTQLKFAPNFL
jgi:hypothetical protein